MYDADDFDQGDRRDGSIFEPTAARLDAPIAQPERATKPLLMDLRERGHEVGEGSERIHPFTAVCVVGMLVMFVAAVVWVLVA